MFDAWMRDLTHGARSLMRAPAFSIIAALTLALGIGANTAIFSVVDAVLLDPLSFDDADELVVIRGTAPGTDLEEEFQLGPEFYLEYSESARGLVARWSYDAAADALATLERADGHWARGTAARCRGLLAGDDDPEIAEIEGAHVRLPSPHSRTADRDGPCRHSPSPATRRRTRRGSRPGRSRSARVIERGETLPGRSAWPAAKVQGDFSSHHFRALSFAATKRQPA